MDSPVNLESLRARAKANVGALVSLYFPVNSVFEVHFGPTRTRDSSSPFEQDLYSVLEKDGLEIVRCRRGCHEGRRWNFGTRSGAGNSG